MPQFSARSSRIALVTHRFRWDRRPQSVSYLKRRISGQPRALWARNHHPSPMGLNTSDTEEATELGSIISRRTMRQGTERGACCGDFRGQPWKHLSSLLPPGRWPYRPTKGKCDPTGTPGETPGMDQQQPTSPMSPPGPGPGCPATGSSNLGQPSTSFSSKAPSINKMHYIHTTDSDSAVNKDEALTPPTRHMNLENRVLHERSPTQKGVYYVITFI